MTELQELESIYCELHKDVHGVKARWYRAESVEQARADLDRLEAAGAVIWAAEAEREAQAGREFMQMVQDTCGGDFEAAVRYQHDAYDTQGDDEFLCYHMGLPYGWFAQQRATVSKQG